MGQGSDGTDKNEGDCWGSIVKKKIGLFEKEVFDTVRVKEYIEIPPIIHQLKENRKPCETSNKSPSFLLSIHISQNKLTSITSM